MKREIHNSIFGPGIWQSTQLTSWSRVNCKCSRQDRNPRGNAFKFGRLYTNFHLAEFGIPETTLSFIYNLLQEASLPIIFGHKYIDEPWCNRSSAFPGRHQTELILGWIKIDTIVFLDCGMTRYQHNEECIVVAGSRQEVPHIAYHCVARELNCEQHFEDGWQARAGLHVAVRLQQRPEQEAQHLAPGFQLLRGVALDVGFLKEGHSPSAIAGSPFGKHYLDEVKMEDHSVPLENQGGVLTDRQHMGWQIPAGPADLSRQPLCCTLRQQRPRELSVVSGLYTSRARWRQPSG
eukprot:scaffold174947_cov43-Prasinocladus_malaysianus.AAC.2